MSDLPTPIPLPTQSPNSQEPRHRGGLNHTYIALISIFIVCCAFFLYLRSTTPRVSSPVRPTTARKRRGAPKRHKPKLWEIYLDGDPHHDLENPGDAVRNWRPLVAWTDDVPMPPHLQQSSFRPEMMVNHVGIAQGWFRDAYAVYPEFPVDIQFPGPSPPAPPPVSNPRKLDVAVLVAMPLQRKDAQPVPGAGSHPEVRSGVSSYNEGQLVLGMTSFRCDQAMRTALKEYTRTT